MLPVGGTAGLDGVWRGLLQRESLLGLRTEDFVGAKVGIICTKGEIQMYHKTHVSKAESFHHNQPRQ